MSSRPFYDARLAGVKCIGQTNPDTGEFESVVPTQAMVDQEESENNDLGAAKDRQREIISQSYASAECESLDININGTNYTYPGGYAAAQIRDDALSLLIRTKARGWQPAEATVTFYDINDKPIYLTEDEADQVVLRTALKFEADYTKNKTCQKAITDAATVEEVRVVTWP